MDGRVKTLHARLYAGLLARRDDEAHLRAAAEQGIEQVDLVCVNLYPFEQTLARGDAGETEIVENIDIGGPTMIRAAAKNSGFAAVVVDPGDYERLLGELRESDGRLSLDTRTRLARQGVRLHRPLRRRDRRLVRRRAPTRAFPPTWSEAYEKVQRSALRREPAPAAPPSTRAPAPPRTCSTGCASCTARSCRSTTCST